MSDGVWRLMMSVCVYNIWVWGEGRWRGQRDANECIQGEKISSWLGVVGSPLVLDCVLGLGLGPLC